ncbi:MAG: hypothetical protein NC324_03160 [Bacteroides sp.]|nr:hypothetical protein [Bacteroides sp.]
MSNTSSRRHIKQGRMVIVAELYKKGWPISKIAEEVRARMGGTCSTRTVWNDINSLIAEWRECRLEDVDARLQLELERIDDCVRELWQQWEKSKEDWTRTNESRVGLPVERDDNGGGGDGGAREFETVRREQSAVNMVGLGDPRYIAEIRQQLMERRKLLGLYSPERKETKITTDLSRDEILKELERLEFLTDKGK